MQLGGYLIHISWVQLCHRCAAKIPCIPLTWSTFILTQESLRQDPPDSSGVLGRTVLTSGERRPLLLSPLNWSQAQTVALSLLVHSPLVCLPGCSLWVNCLDHEFTCAHSRGAVLTGSFTGTGERARTYRVGSRLRVDTRFSSDIHMFFVGLRGLLWGGRGVVVGRVQLRPGGM